MTRCPQCKYPGVRCPSREEQEGVGKNRCLLRDLWACPLGTGEVLRTKTAVKLAAGRIR